MHVIKNKKATETQELDRFGPSTHQFLHGLLNEWGLELQHLNLTGVLHIAGFITVCEAFLRMGPHVDLFR